jgi:polynucleotide 5'-kinase involved in rRNA processing
VPDGRNYATLEVLASVELVYRMFDLFSKQDRYIMVLLPGWIRGRHSFTLASGSVL